MLLRPLRVSGSRSVGATLAAVTWFKSHPVVAAVGIYCSLCYGIVLYTQSLYMFERGLEDYAIELAFVVYGLSRIPIILVMRIMPGRTQLMLVLGVAAMAGGMALTLVGDFVWFAVALALLGFGVSVFLPLGHDVVSSRAKPGQRSMTAGAYEVLVGVGAGFGPLLAALFSEDTLVGGNPDRVYLVLLAAGVAVLAAAVARRRELVPAAR